MASRIFRGVVAPALSGFAVDQTGSFAAALAITAGVLVVGALAWVFVVGRVEQVSWADEERSFDACDERVRMIVGFVSSLFPKPFLP